MAKTADKDTRATYKAAILDLQATLQALADTTDLGLRFWTNELSTVTARHLAKLGAVQARGDYFNPQTSNPIVVEKNAALVAADAARRAVRGIKREDREGAQEAWQRLDAAERTIADLTADREYWRSRAEGIEGVTAEPEPCDFDPRTVDGYELDAPFWGDDSATGQ